MEIGRGRWKEKGKRRGKKRMMKRGGERDIYNIYIVDVYCLYDARFLPFIFFNYSDSMPSESYRLGWFANGIENTFDFVYGEIHRYTSAGHHHGSQALHSLWPQLSLTDSDTRYKKSSPNGILGSSAFEKLREASHYCIGATVHKTVRF